MARGGRRTAAAQLASLRATSQKIRGQTKSPEKVVGILGELLHRRLPLHFGGISDPFQNGQNTRVAVQLLSELNDADYPTIISTKNPNVLTRDENLKLLKKMKSVVVQVSFATSGSQRASLVERNAPRPHERLGASTLLASEGIFTVARVQPFVMPWKREIVEYMIPLLKENGFKHAIFEHLKLPMERRVSLFDGFLRLVGWNAYDDYQKLGATQVGREWILPPSFMWENLQEIRAATRKNGMTFGAADYGLTHLGDTRCCCGVDNLKGFSQWFKGSLSNVIASSPAGTLRWKLASNYWYPSESVRRVLNSQCRKPGLSGIKQYLAVKWDQPGTPNAPDTYLGVHWEGEKDNEGFCVYHKERIR